MLRVIRAGSPELSHWDSTGARKRRESCLRCDTPVEKTAESAKNTHDITVTRQVTGNKITAPAGRKQKFLSLGDLACFFEQGEELPSCGEV